MNEIGERLKHWRTSKGLSTGDIHRKTGLSTGQYSGIENGKTKPGDKVLRALYIEYGLSSDWVLFGAEKDNSQERYQSIINILKDLDERELIKIETYIEDQRDLLISRRATSSSSANTG